MLEPDNWREMGLTEKTVFTLEAMPFWLQYPTGLFIFAIVHEIRRRMMGIDTLTKWIQEDPNAAPIRLEILNQGKSVQELCEMISNYQVEMQNILDIAWEYAKVKDPGSTN